MWKKRLGWLLLCAAALFLYLFENGAGTRLALAAVALLPLPGAIPLLPRPRLAFAWDVPETAHRGEKVSCALKLRRDGRLPSAALMGELEVENLLTGEKTRLPLSCVPPSGETVIPLPLTVAHCGMVSLRVNSSRLQDPFGLFVRPLAVEEARFAVLPDLFPVELSPHDFWRDSDRYSAQHAGSDPSETFRIREYVPGDPVRQIHWKLSEKLDKPLVRDFGLPLGERVLLRLEECPATPDEVDAALDLLFSIGQELCRLELPCTVEWPETPAASPGLSSPAALFTWEDWLALQTQLLSAPLENVRLAVDGISYSY